MDINCPGSQEDLVSNWEPPGSLVEDAISGAEFAPCLRLWLSLACLPASGGGWAGPQPASSPLVFVQSFVLWAGRQYLRLEFFPGKFSLSLAIPQFGLLSHISSLRLPSGHSGLFLTLSNAAHASLFSPCLLEVEASIWATSSLGFAVRRLICGFYLFFPPSYVAF